jgi:hypothetical protein
MSAATTEAVSQIYGPKFFQFFVRPKNFFVRALLYLETISDDLFFSVFIEF